MVSTFSNEVFNGQLRQVQTITYSNGVKSKRIYENPGDSIPMEVIWVKPQVLNIKPEDVVASRHPKTN